MRPVDFVSLALRLSVLSHGNGGNEISHHFDWNVHQSYQSIVRVGLLFTFDWNGRLWYWVFFFITSFQFFFYLFWRWSNLTWLEWNEIQVWLEFSLKWRNSSPFGRTLIRALPLVDGSPLYWRGFGYEYSFEAIKVSKFLSSYGRPSDSFRVPFILFFVLLRNSFLFCFWFFTQSNPVSSRWPFFIYRVLRRFDWIVMRFTGLRLIFYGSSAILCGIYRVLTRWTRWNFNFGSAAFPFTSSSSSVSSRPPLPPPFGSSEGLSEGFFLPLFASFFLFCFFFFNLGKVVASTFWVSVF